MEPPPPTRPRLKPIIIPDRMESNIGKKVIWLELAVRYKGKLVTLETKSKLTKLIGYKMKLFTNEINSKGIIFSYMPLHIHSNLQVIYKKKIVLVAAIIA